VITTKKNATVPRGRIIKSAGEPLFDADYHAGELGQFRTSLSVRYMNAVRLATGRTLGSIRR
jgi:hypothetical protein